jgi:hypothetical protein
MARKWVIFWLAARQFEYDNFPRSTEMMKVMLRLPEALARVFQQVYLESAARYLRIHGKKLLLQDCHAQMMQEWLERQKQGMRE